MNAKTKPKPRMAPVLQPVVDPAKRLELLADWSAEPANPPATGPAAAPEVQAAAAQAQKSEAPAKKEPKKDAKPWEGEGALAPHPYHVVMSEGLFQKIDFVWKRAGNKSMREWILNALEAQANKDLKGMGQ